MNCENCKHYRKDQSKYHWCNTCCGSYYVVIEKKDKNDEQEIIEMAKYVVLPKAYYRHGPIVKCWKCGTIYIPEKEKGNKKFFEKSLFEKNFFEKCPNEDCCCSTNDINNIIPLWKYNLIKYWREFNSK